MTEAEKIQQFYNLLTTSIDVIRNFADKIPGFTDLVKEDQVSDRLRDKRNEIQDVINFRKLKITSEFFNKIEILNKFISDSSFFFLIIEI